MSNPANWIAAFLTLAIYSILFKESEIYYVAETIFVGTTAGYAVATVSYTHLDVYKRQTFISVRVYYRFRDMKGG